MTLVKRLSSAITNRPYWQMYAAGLIILIVSGWFWWNQIYLAPERVFWGMINNSLATRSVTIEIRQANEQSAVSQLMQMELGATDRAHSLTTLRQGDTEVKTEIIGTRDADYTRYRSIRTDQKNAEGKSLNVSKVIGLWSKSEEAKDGGSQLLAQTVLGIGLPIGSVPVPIGEIPATQRKLLARQIKDQNVYSFSLEETKKERKRGRLQYTYDTTIQMPLYVHIMKKFANNLHMDELEQVDPNAYDSAEPLRVRLTIDAASRRLVRAENVTGGYTQTYTGYGLPLTVELPKTTITPEELRRRLTEL